MIDNARFAHQDGLVPREKLAEVTPVVVGAGAIGRPLALQLAGIGCTRMYVIDPGFVDAGDVSKSLYKLSDVGNTKVWAVTCQGVEYGAHIVPVCKRFAALDNLADLQGRRGILFLAAPTDVRKSAYDWWLRQGDDWPLFVSGEVQGPCDQCRYATRDKPVFDEPPNLNSPGATCYAGHRGAARMVHMLTLWLNGYLTEVPA